MVEKRSVKLAKPSQKIRALVGFLVNDGLFAVTALSGVGIALLDFYTDIDQKLGKNYQTIILLMVGLIAVSLWKWRRDSDEYKRLLDSKLEKIASNSAAVDMLLSLSEPGLVYARESVKLFENVNQVLGSLNQGASTLIREMLVDNYERSRHLASADLSVPMWEAPKVNSRLMELFRERMDAVSYSDLKFFGEDELGQRYYEKSVESRGREGQRMAATRLFIVSLEDLYNEKHRDLLVDILDRHLHDKVGFGVAVLEDVRAVIDDFDELGINNSQENADHRVSFDFALFDQNKVVSFFRKGEPRQFFRVVFSTDDPHNPNNILIDNQRKLYRRLVCDCWLVSKNFKQLVQSGLYSDEWEYVERKTSTYSEKIKNRSTHEMEDSMFPLVVDSTAELRDKVSQIYWLRIEVNGYPSKASSWDFQI